MVPLPLEHLSASSLALHARCPRQWADKYLHGVRGPSSSSLIIGSAVHLALSRLFQGEETGNYWKEIVDKEIINIPVNGEILWKDKPARSEEIAKTYVYHYWESVGKWIADDVVSVEREFLIQVEGVGLPIKGFIDLELVEELIDYKTTAYTSKGWVKPQKDWAVQQGIYQLVVPKPSMVHVLTRAKTDPIIVPQSTSDKFYFGLLDPVKVTQSVVGEWERIMSNWERYGMEGEWPGNVYHDYAWKYCNLGERCCAL